MSLMQQISDLYYLRVQRRVRRIRALRKQRELTTVKHKFTSADPNDVLLFATVHNERPRLAYFLDYYRDLGITHFYFVDNGSDDGSGEYLKQQPDVSLWQTDGSYKRAHFGMDWLNGLLRRYAQNRWVLTVDIDEFFVYPHCDTRPINALTDWLDKSSIKSFGAMLLDMYPDKDQESLSYADGQNPFEILTHFDPRNYTQKPNEKYGNLWIQGGPRQREFFANHPEQAPALNKIPLVKWQRGHVFVSSTHTLLPRGLNKTFEDWGGEKICGALLHAKLLPDLKSKAANELHRRQHYAGSREYIAYDATNVSALSHEYSEKFTGWQRLEEIGLISIGGWA